MQAQHQDSMQFVEAGKQSFLLSEYSCFVQHYAAGGVYLMEMEVETGTSSSRREMQTLPHELHSRTIFLKKSGFLHKNFKKTYAAKSTSF